MARTPSKSAHEKVLKAALCLFAENGFDVTSMDAIAESSGVSKATIYKHWANKEALFLEVMNHLHGLDRPRPVFETNDIPADIVSALAYQPAEELAALRTRMMPHFMAYAGRYPEIAHAWRSRILELPRADLARLLKRAIARKELPANLDIDYALAALIGPVMYRHFLKLTGMRLPTNLEAQTVASFWKAHSIVKR